MPYRLFTRKGSKQLWINIKVKGRRRIRRSSGTADRKIAEALAQRIEAGEWSRLIHGDSATLTFAEAGMMYIDDGLSARFTVPLVRHFKDKLVSDLKPGVVRAAAREIYPKAKPATWNRQVLVPVSAIINHAEAKGLAPIFRVVNNTITL